MADWQRCADDAIGGFVRTLGEPYWPNWAGLIPGDQTSGWGAPKGSWRAQAGSIVQDFERFAGVTIGQSRGEIDRLRNETLSVFSDYLVEKAELASAKLAIAAARAHLASLRTSILTFRAR